MTKTKQDVYKDMIESDDELPNDYIEIPEIPAYKMDDRFKDVEFKWIDNNFSQYYKEKSEPKDTLVDTFYSLNQKVVFKKLEKLAPGETTVILRGLLSKKDVYCLKCAAASLNDSTMLWFANFLIYKDMLSTYSFLKPCLVYKPSNVLCENMKLQYKETKKYNYSVKIN